MTSNTGSCSYVLDPQAPETWHGTATDQSFIDKRVLDEDECWHCPHDASDDSEYCVFHQPVDTKDDTAVLEAFVDAVQSDDRNGDSTTDSFACLGARFGDLDLQSKVDTLDIGSIDLSHARVEGDCDWRDIDVDVGYLNLGGVTVCGDVTFATTDFTGYVNFTGVSFQGRTDFESATFDSTVEFRFGEFDDTVSFEQAQFGGPVSFVSATFGRFATFDSTTFHDEASFNRTTCRDELTFRSAVFSDASSFVSMKIHGDVTFQNASFEIDPDFSFTEIGDVDRSGIR